MRIIGNDPSVPRQTHEVASGTLPNGKPVVVNADGTVSAVSGQAEGAGSEATFSSSNTTETHSIYDPDSQKHIIAYKDAGNSNYGKAVVATISGNSVSYGTPVTFEAGETGDIAMCYDTSNNKVIIAFTDGGDGDYGKVVVGTVSGTSISFGSTVVYQSGSTSDSALSYDVAENKVLLVYRDRTNSEKATYLVGTVSGTSISFGSKASFHNGDSYYMKSIYDETAEKHIIAISDVSASFQCESYVATVSGNSASFSSNVTFSPYGMHFALVRDTANNKTVFFYQDAQSNDAGQARVATLSGTTLSFGTEVTYKSTNVEQQGAAYDVASGKVIIAYRSGGDTGDPGNLRVGTVSGTDISFETEVTFNTGSTTKVSVSYNSAETKNLIAFRDLGDSNYGKALVYAIGSTNVTSENYIGISRSGAVDTKGAIINTQGAIADNLSGLTAGQSYFVQTDGTLGTTAADPSVFAGTAVSATKLIVKG